MNVLRRLLLIRPPIRAKLLIGLLFAAALPTVLIVTVFFTARQDIDRQTIRAYIQQNGQRQRQVLINTFVRATTSLEDFSTDRDINQALVAVLLRGVESNPPLPSLTPNEMAQEIERTLLNPNTALFNNVRLLSRDGVLVANAGEQSLTGTAILGSDESRTDAYRRINDLRTTDPNITQTMVVTRFNGGTVEIIHTVKLRTTNNVIGYLVATLNLQETVLPTLSFLDEGFPSYSFLLSENDVIIAPEPYLERAQRSTETEVVQLAFQNETGYRIYRLDSGQGEEVGGYYARIQGTPFVLMTQIAIEDVQSTLTDYFGADAFVFGTVLVVGLLLFITWMHNRDFVAPIDSLQDAVQAMTAGNFDYPLDDDAKRGDEFGVLVNNFIDMRAQVQGLVSDLERRINRRTRDIETTQEISRVAVTQRDLQVTMNQAVNLIVERFGNIYHAQIFLLDTDRRYALLRASTGDVGRELLARGHRLAVGSVSVIGQVTSQGELIIARDTAASEVHRRNEFLPDTRAELAIPLKIGERIIGALDVQSKESATFDDEQIRVLQTLADQLAIAIENTRLYQESVQRLRNIQDRNREEVKFMWQEYMFDRRQQRLVRQAGTPTDAELNLLREQAMQSGKPAIGDITERDTLPIAVPVLVRGEPIGVVAYEIPAKDYSGNKLQLAQELAERLALSMDNTRLYEQSQRATERERLVNEISAKLTTQTDVSEILQTAVREVGQALRAPQVSIRLSRKDANQPNPDDANS